MKIKAGELIFTVVVTLIFCFILSFVDNQLEAQKEKERIQYLPVSSPISVSISNGIRFTEIR